MIIFISFLQVVIMEFDGGQTVSFTMAAFTELICERQTRIHFTNGEVVGDMTTFTSLNFSKHPVLGKDEETEPFRAPSTSKVLHKPEKDIMSGHGGGDLGLIQTFLDAVRLGKQEVLGVTVDDILNSHLTVSLVVSRRKLALRPISHHHFRRYLLQKRAAEKVVWLTSRLSR